MHVIDWLAKHAQFSPDKTALVEAGTGRRFTYRQLNEHASRAANLLERLGVKAGDRVAILSSNCAEALFILFAATKLGAIFLPLNFRLAPPELVPILADAEPLILIYSDEFRALRDAVVQQARIPHSVKLDGAPAPGDLEWATEMRQSSPVRPLDIPVEMDAPQMILYTSGTTGKPKGAVLPHRMIFWNSVNFALRDLLPTDTVLVHTPMFYTGGLNVYTLPAFFLGGTVVLMRAWNADEVLQTIERERVTAFFGVPTQFLMMTQSPLFETADLSSLRWVISGGAPCPIPLIRRLVERGLTFKQGMGLTEVGPNCFALEPRDALRKAGSIGLPNFSIRARIVDDAGFDLGPEEVGELILSTPAMINGYWRNPEATAGAIRDGWFYTGDLAKFDLEGYFYIVDRKKDMFISGGENVYPAEVEQVLAGHPKVAEVAVVGVPHAKWGEVGCAAIALRPGEQATEEEFIAFCQGRIAKYKVPKSVVFVPALPRTHSGKVQKQLLRNSILGA